MNRIARTVITFVAAACLLAVGLAAGYKMSQIKTEIAEVVTVSTTESTTERITEKEVTKTDFFGEVVDEYESSEGVVTLENEESEPEETTESTTVPATTKPVTTTVKPTQATTASTTKATTSAPPKTTAQNYFVSFDKNGGSGTFHRLSGEPSYIIPKSVPEKKGYTFKGWFSDTDGKIYQPGEKITPVGRTTLTAIWEAK